MAVRNAVAIFENRATEIIGIRDEPKMAFGRLLRKGQMDCVDESIDTEQFLRVFENDRLIHFHKVEKGSSRGIFIDERYPHWTAVITDNDNKNGQLIHGMRQVGQCLIFCRFPIKKARRW